jgi:hypothetical protein
MFGCIGRLVVLGVLLALGCVAYLTRGTWEPKVRARLGMKPPVVAAKGAGWEPVTVAGAERARTELESFKRPSGPVFLNVKAADLVAYALEPAINKLDASATAKSGAGTPAPVAAMATENEIAIRGSVSVGDIGDTKDLGPLGDMLKGTQKIEVRGRPEVDTPGHAHFRVDRIVVGELTLPSPLIGRLVQRLVPKADKSAADEVIALGLPREVADVRVTPGRVTLYKAVAEKAAR